MSDQLGPLEEEWLEFCATNKSLASETCGECFQAGFTAAQRLNLKNDNKYRQLISILTMEFEERLQAKTGWGRNDIKNAFHRATIQALARTLDNQDLT